MKTLLAGLALFLIGIAVLVSVVLFVHARPSSSLHTSTTAPPVGVVTPTPSPSFPSAQQLPILYTTNAFISDYFSYLYSDPTRHPGDLQPLCTPRMYSDLVQGETPAGQQVPWLNVDPRADEVDTVSWTSVTLTHAPGPAPSVAGDTNEAIVPTTQHYATRQGQSTVDRIVDLWLARINGKWLVDWMQESPG